MVAVKSPSSSTRPCPICAKQVERAAFQFPYCSEKCRRASRANAGDAGVARVAGLMPPGGLQTPQDWREFIAG